MYSAIIKRQCLRPSVVRISQLPRASVHSKAQSGMKGDDDFYMTTSFPDDFEASPLKPELLQRQPDAEALSGPWDQATIEQHKKDIYESIYPQEPNNKASAKPMDTSLEDEHAPDMDEM